MFCTPDQPHQHKQNRKKHNDNTPQTTVPNGAFPSDINSIYPLFTTTNTMPPNLSFGIFPSPRFHSPALLPLLALQNMATQMVNYPVNSPANQTTNSSIFPQLPSIQQKQQKILEWIQAMQQQRPIAESMVHQYLTTKIHENTNSISNSILKNETNVAKKFDFADISSCVGNDQKYSRGIFTFISLFSIFKLRDKDRNRRFRGKRFCLY